MRSEQSSSIYSVSSLNAAIKASLESNPQFSSINLRAEISNFKIYPSGHCYFTLKDDKSVLSAVMWASEAAFLRFSPKNGDEVLCKGRISVYPPRGSYQFVASRMELAGEGNELAKLRALALKLKAEGLFEQSRKRPIPAYPHLIGVIAGKGSAGMKDIVHNISLRYQNVTLYLFPSLVQGEGAPKALLEALNNAISHKVDTLIIGRGGGSSEDLGAFNDETLVRAVAACPIPVISAVGHEVDMTLIDLVADKRVSTPTAAAVLAVPDSNELLMALDDYGNRLYSCISGDLARMKEKVALLSNRSFFINPKAIYADKIDNLEKLSKRFDLAMASQLNLKKTQVAYVEGKLASLNPYSVLNRGYAISTDETGKVVASIKDIKTGSKVKTRLNDGIIESTVTDIKES